MDNEELDGVKFSEFPSQTPVNADEVVGLHSGGNARFSIANIVAAVRNGLANIFVPKTDVGAANGVAELDSTGKVPSAQLPPIASTAADVTYDNTQSGLAADDVQEAIDELAQGGGGGPSPYTSNPEMDGTASPGSSNNYARGDHVHPENPANAKTAQLAYVETGTTASRNYTAGQYIALNGLLYTADTAIASGATLYTSGGNKNLTECVGGGFNFSTPIITTASETGSGTIYIAPTPPAGYKTGVLIGFEASYQYNAITLVGVYSLGYNYPFRIIVNSSANQTVGAKILWFR